MSGTKRDADDPPRRRRVSRKPAETGGFDQADFANLASFRSALRRFLAFSEAATSAAGVGPLQYQALLAIRAQPAGALTIKALAEELLLLPNSAVQLVNRLVRAGLVARKPSPLDRRSVLVHLTPKGQHLVEGLATAHHAELIAQKPLLAESLARLRRLGGGRSRAG